jgi:hypothetical protein
MILFQQVRGPWASLMEKEIDSLQSQPQGMLQTHRSTLLSLLHFPESRSFHHHSTKYNPQTDQEEAKKTSLDHPNDSSYRHILDMSSF